MGKIQYTAAVSMKIDIKFIQNPFLIISSILRIFDPKTTAFGGVATGSINAQEAATVAPTSKKNAFTSIVSERATSTGNSIAVVAKLDVISVKKLTIAIRINNKNKSGIALKKFIWLPIHIASPLESNPFASAMPPPNSNKIPHGNFTASAQLSSFLLPSLLFLLALFFLFFLLFLLLFLFF